MPRAARAPRLTIELYYENGKNANLTVSSFRRAYPAHRTLCRSTVLRLVAKFEEHGTMEDRLKGHCGRKKSIRVPSNINTLAQIVQRNPQASIQCLHAQTGFKKTTICKMLRMDLHMKPYIPHPVQALKTPDAAKRVKWAEDFLDAVELDYTYPEYILWTDEAIFHLNGTVNRHNSITWASTNPHLYVEKDTQNKAGVMVWVGLIKDHIIGPFFFNGKVTGDLYLQLLQTRVLPSLQAIMADDVDFVIFQQDGASPHYSTKAREWLDELI